MIDYQPTTGLRHCLCRDVSDGFTYSSTAETYVHAACGKPRPTVETNLHALPAPVEPKTMTVVAEVVPPVELTPVPAELLGAVVTGEGVPVGVVLVPEPPAEQPTRRRGRPPKDTKGFALEKRDAPDRWCVIHEATGEIIAWGLTSKAKATAEMDDLIRKATDGDSPADQPTAVELPADQHAADARGTESSIVLGETCTGSPHLPNCPATDLAGPAPGDAELTTPGPTGGDHVPAGAGQPAGPAAGGVRADLGGTQLAGQDPRRAEDVHQGGAGPAVPGPGSGSDQPQPDAAAAALPAGQGEGGPQDHREGVPGDLGPVHDGGHQLDAGPTLTEGQPVIHGPQGDCPDCFQRWDWCPSSGVPSNPAAAETSPDVSERGGLPASAILLGSNGSTGPSTAVDTLPLPGAVIDSSRPSLAAFMSAAKHVAQSGNTPWAARYANELRQIVIDRAENAPRNLQRHLGPSEIGVPCDRQVVGKLVGFERTNHVTDPWPSIMGTAGHAWMEDTFRGHNDALGWQRWLVEQRVTPHPDHAGTSDLYDAANLCVDDHKFLGETSMAKLRADKVPPQYFFQLLTYRRGYQLMGLRVDRIVIIGWPRTGSSVDGMYVWEHECTPEDDVKLDTLFARMQWRKQWAAAISAGNAKLSDVPAVPDPDDCYFCPFYRPAARHDGGPGCPGHVGV
jgi:hypothetical protein